MDRRILCCCLLLVAIGAVCVVGAAAPDGTFRGGSVAAATPPEEPSAVAVSTSPTAFAATNATVTNATPTGTQTPTPAQSPAPVPALVVDGTLVNRAPPANTDVEHVLRLGFDAPIANGTTVLFPEAYSPSDVRIRSVQAIGDESAGTPVRATLTAREAPNGTELRPGVELTTPGQVRNTTVEFVARHPDVTNETEYELAVAGPVSEAIAVAEYRVRPVGSDHRSGPAGEFDRANGEGFVYPNATVYLGERDIEFRGGLSEPLRGVGGDTEGTFLEPPIPTDARTGRYSVGRANDTASIQLQEPKITTLRLENSDGTDVTDGRVYAERSDTVTVIAQSNFEDAEKLELTVTNGNGLDITDELINTSRVRAETPFGRPAGRSMKPPTRGGGAATGITDPELGASRPHGRAVDGLQPASVAVQPDAATEVASPEVTVRDAPDSADQLSTFQIEYGIENAGGIQGAFTVETANLPLGVTVDGIEGDIKSSDTDGSPPSASTVSVPAGETATVTVTYDVSVFATTGETEFNLAASQPLDGTADDVTAIVSINRSDTGGAGTDVGSAARVRWQLDLSEIETRTLSVAVTGSDDLDSGRASSERDLTVSDRPPSLSFSNTSPNRGQRPTITVSNGVYGAEYVLGVDANDLRNDLSDSEYDSVFRDVGTTEEIGVVTQSGTQFTGSEEIEGEPTAVYARVRIDPDDGSGRTQLETTALGDQATLDLLQHNTSATGLFGDERSADSREIRIGDPAISLSGPDSYVVGEETTLQGSADGGIDGMVLYARSNETSEFELVDLDGSGDGDVSGLSVSGSFGKDVELSSGDAPGNQLLSFPGTYRAAALPEADLPDQGSTAPGTLSPAAVLDSVPGLHTIRIRKPGITVERPGLGGRLAASAGTIEVDGHVTGRESALLVAVGERGALATEQVGESNFTDVELSVAGFPEGEVTLFAVSSGRDGQIGDGSIRGARIAAAESPLSKLESHLVSVASTARNGDQIRAVLRSETDRDTASDDPIAAETFRIVPANVEITTPETNATIEPGTELEVAGRTTVPSRVTPLEVSLAQGIGTDRRERISPTQNGSWQVSIRTGGLEPGRYRITARTSGVVDFREVVIGDGPTTARSVRQEVSGAVAAETSESVATPTIEPEPTRAVASSGSGRAAAEPADPTSQSSGAESVASPARTGSGSPASGQVTSDSPASGYGTLGIAGLVVCLVTALLLWYRD